MPHDPGSIFRALHVPGKPFILANAWDIGSAKMLTALGAEAIATSSAAYAFTLGLPDGGTVNRDAALAHAQDLIAAVDVPVSGDFEDGYGADPDAVAETVRLSAEIGLAGICVEDTIFDGGGYYGFEVAVDRIRAGAAAARGLAKDFVFVARADGLLTGSYGIDEAIRRVQAFEAAGADAIYAPMPASMEDLARIVKSVSVPVNALAAGPFTKVSQAEYAAVGVARISLGSSLARVTHKAIMDAGQAMFGAGDFTPLGNSVPASVVDPMLKR